MGSGAAARQAFRGGARLNAGAESRLSARSLCTLGLTPAASTTSHVPRGRPLGQRSQTGGPARVGSHGPLWVGRGWWAHTESPPVGRGAATESGFEPLRSLMLPTPLPDPRRPVLTTRTQFTHQTKELRDFPFTPAPAPGAKVGRKGQRRGSYADVLCQGDHPLVGFDPWGGLVQRAGRQRALGQRPQVCDVYGLTAELPGACGHSRAGRGWEQTSVCPAGGGDQADPCPRPPQLRAWRGNAACLHPAGLCAGTGAGRGPT